MWSTFLRIVRGVVHPEQSQTAAAGSQGCRPARQFPDWNPRDRSANPLCNLNVNRDDFPPGINLPFPMRAYLRRLNELPAGRDLILRGSAAMTIQVPELARQPNDLDFVIDALPWDVEATIDDACNIDGFHDGFEFRFNDASEELWDYSEAPGIRFSIEYRLLNNSWNAFQVDIAEEDVEIEAVSASLETTSLELARDSFHTNICQCEDALSWKLKWLIEDDFEKPEDIYDTAALLLAGIIDRQRFQESLRRIFDASGLAPDDLIDLCHLNRFQIDKRFHFMGDRFPTPMLPELRLLDCMQVIAHRLPPLLEGLVHIPSDEEWDFLAEIDASGNDVSAWLVFADWLEEQGDIRGEYFRLSLASSLSREQKQRLKELSEQVAPYWRVFRRP